MRDRVVEERREERRWREREEGKEGNMKNGRRGEKSKREERFSFSSFSISIYQTLIHGAVPWEHRGRKVDLLVTKEENSN